MLKRSGPGRSVTFGCGAAGGFEPARIRGRPPGAVSRLIADPSVLRNNSPDTRQRQRNRPGRPVQM